MKTGLAALFLILQSSYLIAQWVPITPPPNNFRTDHSFGFAINDIGYLVAGTDNGAPASDFYSYDATTDQWSTLPAFPGGTRGYAIGDVSDTKAYFGFGTGTSPGQIGQERNDLWEFDPTTGQWTELASCPCVTRLHPAFVINQGKIFIGMGSNTTLGNLNDWWEYDIATDIWTQKTNFPSFKRHHPYQFAIGDFVYTGFGHGSLGAQIYKQWYQYDIFNDTWTQVSDIPGEGRVAGTQFSHDGYGYILSGDGQTHSSMSIGEFWRYDGGTDTWLQFPSHPGSSRWAPASFIINDEIYLINGAETPAYFYPNTSFKFNLGTAVANIDELGSNELVSAYPNPFFDGLQLDVSAISKFENKRFEIINPLGQIILSKDFETETIEKLDLSFLDQGVYWVSIYSSDKRISNQKIVKSE